MKLKKIKLSGFKSFVDSTAVELQSNLTGVVGPNGCGKSNIIDATRWVMGEASAKQLRGESMSDVIFNGSAARKPVGVATAELVFDNSDASLGGEYAKYSEIAIRREVSRDGISDYFLNNSGCRRKDVTNIFLGTGLGINSYAIIEQGMISRFVEAKPDELRIFIEEAAGISKYKERRRETENRIKHTKENLSRLNDILSEIDKQLKHLKTQANAAERYKKFKQEERLTKAELYTLHWRELNKKLLVQDGGIKDGEIQLENKITELHVLSGKIAELREEHSRDLENFNKVQGNYYRIGASIVNLEQQIQHAKERKEQLTRDLAQIDQVWEETTTHQVADQEQIELLILEKQKIEVDIVEMQTTVSLAQQKLQEAEQQMRQWQSSWDNFTANSSKVSQVFEVEQTRIKHLEQSVMEEEQTLEKLKSELTGLDFTAATTEAERLNNLFTGLKLKHEKLHENVAAKQQQITERREVNGRLAVELDQTRNRLQTLIGRQSSLEALQQAAFGKNDAVLVDWLRQHNLAENSRLAQKIQVVAGWETAVETVLGVYLEAVCVEGISKVVTAVKSLLKGSLVLVDQASQVRTVGPRLNFPTLASKISSSLSLLSLDNLLRGIYIAENINEALAMQAELNSDESIVTKDGIWFGAGWLRVAYDETNHKVGILQRERELQELNGNIAAEQHRCTEQTQELERYQTVLTELEQEHQELQQQLRFLTAEYSETQSKAAAKKTYLQYLQERAQTLNQEVKIHEDNLRSKREQLDIVVKSRAEAADRKSINDAERQALVQQRDQVQQCLASAREHVGQVQQDGANLTMRLQLLQTKIDYLSQNLERANVRLASLKEHQASIKKSLIEADVPITDLEKTLQLELEQRLGIEADLTLAKQKATTIEQELHELEQKYSEYQELTERIRLSLEKLRTERQGLQVRSVTYKEQVGELEFQLEDLNSGISETVLIPEWEEKLAHLTARIERLGLINLAAIEEFEQLQERKNYLDTQGQDLINALNTLEEVIHKIDHDTKERFKEAYDKIDQKFQELFPKVFNGGRAYLEQTANNLLETGVLIMAQPPGKRNSSIHLLSGGEKALTAIALIFSIFHLNPAPFCILDEVDAPLDDINVLRFCNLVKEMSKSIQFIFITHNKLTMEIAGQLVGVTMQEPGVSRIVTVDIDTAISLAGAEK